MEFFLAFLVNQRGAKRNSNKQSEQTKTKSNAFKGWGKNDQIITKETKLL